MSQGHYDFHVVNKVVIVNDDTQLVLVGRRQGKADLDGYWTFLGGKMEHRDQTIPNSIARELAEEAGPDVHFHLLPNATMTGTYTRSDGARQVLIYHIAMYQGGELIPSPEYSEFRWFTPAELRDVSPARPDLATIALRMLALSD